jgi:hypothetical protein
MCIWHAVDGEFRDRALNRFHRSVNQHCAVSESHLLFNTYLQICCRPYLTFLPCTYTVETGFIIFRSTLMSLNPAISR